MWILTVDTLTWSVSAMSLAAETVGDQAQDLDFARGQFLEQR
jgi:hypothetical protein